MRFSLQSFVGICRALDTGGVFCNSSSRRQYGNVSYIQVIKSDVLTDIMAAINDNGIKPYNIGIEHTGRGRVASGNGNGERNCMCKNSGKISVFSVRCSEGGRKVLEIIEEAEKEASLKIHNKIP